MVRGVERGGPILKSASATALAGHAGMTSSISLTLRKSLTIQRLYAPTLASVIKGKVFGRPYLRSTASMLDAIPSDFMGLGTGMNLTLRTMFGMRPADVCGHTIPPNGTHACQTWPSIEDARGAGPFPGGGTDFVIWYS